MVQFLSLQSLFGLKINYIQIQLMNYMDNNILIFKNLINILECYYLSY